MARRFAKVSQEEIEEAFFYPSDPLRLIFTSKIFCFFIHVDGAKRTN